MKRLLACVLVMACRGPASDHPDAAGGDDAADAAMMGGDAAVGPEWTIAADDTGIQRIERYGANLLEGVGGYYIIGSCTGADDNNNVTSQGSDGHTLRAPGSCPGAPFSLTVTGANPYHVAIAIGPLPVAYRTLSVPLDPRKDLIERFAFDGNAYQVGCGVSYQPRTGSGATFDTIPLPCTIPDVGNVGVARVVPAPAFGEIAGPLGSIRRRIASGDAKELDFINHPGTNNIEIAFTNDFTQSIPAGTIVQLVEDIELVDPAIAPPVTRHEVEARTFGHDIGRAEAEGWSANTAQDAAGYLVFGPYLSLSPGHFDADFRLLVDNNSADDLVVARIEVSDFTTGHTLAQRDLHRMEFTTAAAYQDFRLGFESPGGTHELELRTYWLDRSYVREDDVVLHWPR